MKSRNIRVGAVLLLLAVALMITYVWKGDRGRSLSAKLDDVKVENRALIDEQDRLRTEVVALSSIERIKRIATDRLGLVEPAETPVDVPAVAPMAIPDSSNIRATGLEVLPTRNNTPARTD